MGWAAMLTLVLPMLMQSCQNGASIAKYDPVSTFTNGRRPEAPEGVNSLTLLVVISLRDFYFRWQLCEIDLTGGRPRNLNED